MTITEHQAFIDENIIAPRRAPLLIYPGAKSSITAKRAILAAFPRKFSEYREPFVGGGSIAMTMPLGVRRWINDIDPALIAFYTAMKERPNQFIKAVRSLVSDDLDTNAETFQRLLCDNRYDLAVRYLFLNRFAYNGRVRLEGEWRYRTTFSEERGYSFFDTDRLERAIPIFRNMKITCGDYAPLLRTPGKDVVVFIDSPYVLETRAHPSARWYHNSFDRISDHHRLRDEVNASIHKVVMTYDDEPLIRQLYSDSSRYTLRSLSWTYMGNTTRRRGRELLITNFVEGSDSVLPNT
jgi:DNA adenine methylase